MVWILVVLAWMEQSLRRGFGLLTCVCRIPIFRQRAMAKARPKKISSILFERIRGEIPSAQKLVLQAVEAKLSGYDDVVAFVRENFSQLIEELQKEAYDLYLASEKASASKIIRQSVAEQLSEAGNVKSALDHFAASFGDLDKFFLSLTQSRRARAGSAFQDIVSILMKELGYPFDAQPIMEDSKPDYVMPSLEWYRHDASDCIILTLKRTLRERWRQVPTEGNSGSTFFLGTIDEKVPPAELKKMQQLNVRMVVPARLKIKKYSSSPAVISFEYFFEQYVEPAIKRWKLQKAL